MKNFGLTIAALILKPMMAAASPVIRGFLKEKLTELKSKAEETPNKFDDILADSLYDIIVGE